MNSSTRHPTRPPAPHLPAELTLMLLHEAAQHSVKDMLALCRVDKSFYAVFISHKPSLLARVLAPIRRLPESVMNTLILLACAPSIRQVVELGSLAPTAGQKKGQGKAPEEKTTSNFDHILSTAECRQAFMEAPYPLQDPATSVRLCSEVLRIWGPKMNRKGTVLRNRFMAPDGLSDQIERATRETRFGYLFPRHQRKGPPAGFFRPECDSEELDTFYGGSHHFIVATVLCMLQIKLRSYPPIPVELQDGRRPKTVDDYKEYKRLVDRVETCIRNIWSVQTLAEAIDYAEAEPATEDEKLYGTYAGRVYSAGIQNKFIRAWKMVYSRRGMETRKELKELVGEGTNFKLHGSEVMDNTYVYGEL